MKQLRKRSPVSLLFPHNTAVITSNDSTTVHRSILAHSRTNRSKEITKFECPSCFINFNPKRVNSIANSAKDLQEQRGRFRRDREKRSMRGDTLSQVERARVSLHRKWLCAKEISIPLTWNSNESRERVRPAGCNKFFLLLNPPAGHPRIYRRRGTISRRLDYCRNTSDRLPTKLFFYSKRDKKRKL